MNSTGLRHTLGGILEVIECMKEVYGGNGKEDGRSNECDAGGE